MPSPGFREGRSTEARSPRSPLQQRDAKPLKKPRRHTCATPLLAQGTHPKFFQELLGHATIAITLDTYSHVMPSMGDQTARAMQNARAAAVSSSS